MIQRILPNAARARRRSIALALAAFAAGALACSMPAFAGAAPPTAQASYYGLDWVPYIDPADLPSVAQRPPTCIVDTGTATTPDLPASDVNSRVIARLAIDSGSGEPFTHGAVDYHGSAMATYAFGADNDWGITGIFPQGRVITVRAQATTGGGIYYAPGARACRDYATTHGLQLSAISMSLGSPRTIEPGELDAMTEEVAAAQLGNYSIVAAAGNSGTTVGFPGSYPGVFTAAAGVTGGSLCSYASYGAQVEIVGPSCAINDVNPFDGTTFQSDNGGSSMATVVTASVIALLRNLKPSATYSQIQGWITSGANVIDGKPLLNGYGAMYAAGLADVLARAQARQQAAQQTNDPPTGNQKDGSATLRTPRARVSYSRRSVRVKALNRPFKSKLVVRLVYRKSEFATKSLKRSSSKSRLVIRSKKRPWRVEIRYVKGSSVSPTVRFRSRRTSTFVQLTRTSNQ